MSEQTLTDLKTSIQDYGRRVLTELAAVLKNVSLYERKNVVLRDSTEKLRATIEALREIDGGVRVLQTLDYFAVNDVRLRTDISGTASHRYLMEAFVGRELGSIKFEPELTVDDLHTLAECIQGVRPDSEQPYKELHANLVRAGLETVEIEKARPIAQTDFRGSLREQVKTRSMRQFFRSIDVTRDLLETSDPKRFNFRRVRRVVQGIVDTVTEEESFLLALTMIKNYDDYTYNHSSNVAVYALTMGQRLGLRKQALSDLGMAGLLHDLGKTKVPKEILNKPGRLQPDEWEMMKNHSVHGAQILLRARELNESVIRSIIVSFEHHLHLDLGGYPDLRDHRELNLFSKIIAIADCFDALTTPRVYRNSCYTPQEALSVLLEGRGTLFDPVLLKIFVNSIGVHPVGTLVELDTGDMAVVVKPHREGRRIDRPVVRIFADDDGEEVEPRVVDLSETDEFGEPIMRIRRPVDPSDYFTSIEDYLTVL